MRQPQAAVCPATRRHHRHQFPPTCRHRLLPLAVSRATNRHSKTSRSTLRQAVVPGREEIRDCCYRALTDTPASNAIQIYRPVHARHPVRRPLSFFRSPQLWLFHNNGLPFPTAYPIPRRA